MARSGERFPLWPPSATDGGPDLYSMVPNYGYLPGSQETQTESDNLENSERTEDSFGQPWQVVIGDDPPNLEQRSGNLLGTLVTEVTSSQHTNSGVEENFPERGRRKGKRTGARIGEKPAEDKRTRAQNWGDQEKTSLLAGKLEFFQLCLFHCIGILTFNFSKSWSHYVANRSIGRNQKSCQGQWDTLLKDHKAILDHEEKIHSGASSHPSFWTMNQIQKDIANQERSNASPTPRHALPQVFQRGWCKLIELIHQSEDAISKLRACSGKKTKRIPVDPNPPSSSTAPRTVLTSTNTNSANVILAGTPGSQGAEDEVLGMDYDELMSRVVAPFVNKQIADKIMPLTSALENLEDAEKTNRNEMLALKGYIQDLMPGLNTRYSGISAIENADLAYPGAGVALSFEPSLSHGALHIANSHDPLREVFHQFDANAGLGRSINIYPEAETEAYSNGVQTNLGHAGQHAIHQMQTPNEDFSTSSQYSTQLNSRQMSDQC